MDMLTNDRTAIHRALDPGWQALMHEWQVLLRQEQELRGIHAKARSRLDTPAQVLEDLGQLLRWTAEESERMRRALLLQLEAPTTGAATARPAERRNGSPGR